MKVTLVDAFQSDDGSLWETEKEAIDSNITECINKINISSGDTYSQIEDKIKFWLRDEKVSVRYVLKNINKIDI